MDLSRLLRSWIVVQHVAQDGTPDGMGDPTEQKTYSRYRGYVWQTGATEQTANTAVASETWQLAIHRSASGQIDAGDRIVLDGELDGAGILVAGIGEAFDVAGPPWSARNPRTQVVEYVQARLDRSS